MGTQSGLVGDVIVSYKNLKKTFEFILLIQSGLWNKIKKIEKYFCLALAY